MRVVARGERGDARARSRRVQPRAAELTSFIVDLFRDGGWMRCARMEGEGGKGTGRVGVIRAVVKVDGMARLL